MKKYIFALLLACANLALADVPDCGQVQIDQQIDRSTMRQWVVGNILVEASPGALRLLYADGSLKRINLGSADERLLATFSWANKKYLLTTQARGFTVYEFIAAAAEPLRKIRAEFTPRPRDGRAVYFVPVDYQIMGQEIFLLGQQFLLRAPLAQFVGASAPLYQEALLPTTWKKEEFRPIALFPYYDQRGFYIFRAPPGGGLWEQSYGYSITDHLIETDVKNRFGNKLTFVTKIQNRGDQRDSWITLDKNLYSVDRQGISYGNAYPVDAFVAGEDQLITFYDLGTYFFREGQLLCRAFDREVRSAVIYRQNSPTGIQLAFLGISHKGELFKNVLYTNP